MWGSFLFFLYEPAQYLLFALLKFIAFISKNAKLKKICDLRSPHLFLQSVKDTKEKLTKETKQLFWIHVSSAGEMEQAIPLARQFHEKLGVQFFVTYYSPSAEPFLKNFPAAIALLGLPLDLKCLYKKLLETLPISQVFFVRYDIWPEMLIACSEKKLKINLVSATKTKTRSGFRGLLSKQWNRFLYAYFDNIFAVSEDDETYFKNVSPHSKVILAGDPKWARAQERSRQTTKSQSDPIFTKFIEECVFLNSTGQRKILVFGSPHIEEHNLFLQLKGMRDKYFLIYVPHHIDAQSVQLVEQDLKQREFNFRRFSQTQENFTDTNVLIFDKMGFLAEIYQIANAAIIGGGFDGQIHNVLEAAACGTPTLFGSNYKRAREAEELVQANGALSFESPNNLFQFLSTWVNFDTKSQSEASQLAAQLNHARENAQKLFQTYPNSSEVILNAVSE